jgi:tetratricopeptide (TPR) repeat protein
MAESRSSNVSRIPRRYLRLVPSLASLKSEDLDWVHQRLQRREYAVGETIVRRGVHGGFLGIIESGQARVIFQTPGGRHRTTTLRPGDSITPHSEATVSATVRAITPVALWTLGETDAARLDQRISPPPRSSSAQSPAPRSPTRWLTPMSSVLHKRSRLATLTMAVLTALFIWVISTSPAGQGFLADLQYARGCLLLEQGRADVALRAFEATLEINPAHAASYNALGYVYYQQNRLEDAFGAFEQASRIAPDSDVIQNNLGLVLDHRGETERALDSLRRAADLSHNVPQVYVNLGNLYLGKDDWLHAGRAYREALRLDPQLAAAHYNLGVAYYHLRQSTDAQGKFEQALQVDPGLQAAYLGLGIVAFEQSRFGAAQSALQRAVELNPRDANAYYYLGLIYNTLGHQEQAIEAFERAIGLTSDPLVREQTEWQLKELWGMP